MDKTFLKMLAIWACVTVSPTANAQGFGGGPGGIGGIGDIGSIGSIGSIPGAAQIGLTQISDLVNSNISGLTDITASMISDQIDRDRDFCANVQREYQIGCIADRFGALADQLPNKGDYREIRHSLRTASRDLDNIARQFANLRAPKKRFKSGTGKATIRTGRLTRIDPNRRAEATIAAAAVINDLQTVLLRSTNSAGGRQALYQEISAAVGSNKLLLRS